MKTKIFKKEELSTIKEWIKDGKVIAFPTDTVFGLGVLYSNEEALKNLKQAKLRDGNKPIPMMVKSIEQLEKVAYVDERVKLLADRFMPGALTLILKRRESVPAYVSDYKDTIALRIPDDNFVLSLLEEPMLVTSANLSGETPGKNEHDVLLQLNGRIDAIVEGEAKRDIPSTIVDLSSDKVIILREGEICADDINETLTKGDKR
ncbi:L-threonylcarbamoyladenylate synthase [Breznakia pachnodae]|uniref:L-threonylcarbamoyladenylate synthase n=1 Tax=Breznakia pachnodae TaxID=265178 RepID=A0ABU0E2H4_9FIRM|nr:L-threonylcarbamoyladenylate synthase [Breznakia pachnodae]MDQ0361098.1 L-threonylcarbamoyladenylate synthase [Breznakia pachnodae]